MGLFGSSKNNGIFWSLFVFEAALLAGFEVSKWLGLLGLAFLCFLVKSVYDGSYAALSTLLNKRIFLGLLILQGSGWFAHIFVKYFSVAYGMYDTGNFAHLIFNISSGVGFYHNVLQTSAWADHFTPNLVIFAPLFWIKPTVLWLPVVRWIAYLACLPILWGITKFYLHDVKWRYLVIILWLINYGLLKMLSWECHVSSFALPFLFLSFYLYLKKRYTLFMINLLWLLGFKEHMALAWLSTGIWLFFFQNAKRWGISVIAGGIFAAIAVVYILIPCLSGGLSSHQFEKFGPFKMLPEKAEFILLILLSVGFLPLLSPKTLLFILPALGISIISNKPSMVRLDNYYQDLPMAMVFVGVIISLSALEKKEGWFPRINRRLQRICIIMALSGLILYNNHYPLRIIRQQWPAREDFETLSEIHRFQKEINKQVALWTTDTIANYFIDLPDLRLIDLHCPLSEEKAHYILFDTCSSEFSMRYAGLKQVLESPVRENHYEELPGFKRLIIYKSK